MKFAHSTRYLLLIRGPPCTPMPLAPLWLNSALWLTHWPPLPITAVLLTSGVASFIGLEGALMLNILSGEDKKKKRFVLPKFLHFNTHINNFIIKNPNKNIYLTLIHNLYQIASLG